MFLYVCWEGVSIDTVLTQIQLRGLGVDSAATVRHGVVSPDSDGRTQSLDEPVQIAWSKGECRLHGGGSGDNVGSSPGQPV